LNANQDEEVRATVLAALITALELEKEYDIKDWELKNEVLQKHLAGNITELNSALSTNSYLTPRGVIGKYL